MWQNIDLDKEMRKSEKNMASNKKILKKFQSFKSPRIMRYQGYEPNNQM